MKTIKNLLAEHPFFRNLEDSQIELLAGCGKNIHFKKGERLFKEGESSDYFYVIRNGNVALQIDGVQRGSITIQTLGGGEILGWSWLIPPHTWNFSATALEETSAVALDGKCLRGKCEKDHKLGYALLKKFAQVLASRLEWTRIQLLDLYSK